MSIFEKLLKTVHGGSRDIHCYIICCTIPGKIRTVFTGKVMFSQVSVVSPLKRAQTFQIREITRGHHDDFSCQLNMIPRG